MKQNSQAAPTKPYRGAAMEGVIARWYARNTRRGRGFPELAQRIFGMVPEGGRVLEVAPGPAACPAAPGRPLDADPGPHPAPLAGPDHRAVRAALPRDGLQRGDRCRHARTSRRRPRAASAGRAIWPAHICAR